MYRIKSVINLLIVLLIIACTNPVEKPKHYKTTLVKWKSKNGEIRAKGILMNGQKQGLWNEFTDDGDIVTQCEYINDTINGECFGYFDSGKLMIKGFYTKGLKDSVWTFYHENGKLWKQGKFKLDKQAGVWEYYYASGTLEKQKSY